MKENQLRKDITIVRHLTLTYELLTDILSLITIGGIDYWGELCFEGDDYASAREYLIEQVKAGKIQTMFDDELCYEDVLAGILLMGKKLILWDREEDEDHPFTLDDLCKGIEHYFSEDENTDPDPDTWDAGTGDGISQFVAFGEWVYG